VLLLACWQTALAQTTPSQISIQPSDPRVEIVGRYDARDPQRLRFGYPGSGFLLRFRGRSLNVEVSSDSDKAALTVVVDHGLPELRVLEKGRNDVVLASQLSEDIHTVEVYKRTETWQGIVAFSELRLSEGGELLAPPPLPRRKLMFIGDSVTCGAGIDNNAECKADPALPGNNAYEAYGMLLGRRLDAQSHLVCYGGRGLERDYRGLGEADGVVNIPQFYQLAIASDEPSGRVPWDASRWQPDAIVVSLGTNDFNLQKTKPLDQKRWINEYVDFVRFLRKTYRHAFILLTEGSIVTDPLLRQMVQETVAKVRDKKVRYVSSQHYSGLACDAHPTQAQHVKIADDLEPAIRQTLGW
jgi:lysophospholipase L1-like esterase